jgi:hypothetical protein
MSDSRRLVERSTSPIALRPVLELTVVKIEVHSQGSGVGSITGDAVISLSENGGLIATIVTCPGLAAKHLQPAVKVVRCAKPLLVAVRLGAPLLDPDGCLRSRGRVHQSYEPSACSQEGVVVIVGRGP